MLDALLSVIYRALDKIIFAECHSRRIMTFETYLLYQAQNTRHIPTLGKGVFAECQAFNEMRHTINGCQQPSIVDDHHLYRVFVLNTRQNNFFVECPL